MRDEYDFSNGIKNPYAKKLREKKLVTVSTTTLEYFQGLEKESGIPTDVLIEMYLRHCVKKGLRPQTDWFEKGEAGVLFLKELYLSLFFTL